MSWTNQSEQPLNLRYLLCPLVLNKFDILLALQSLLELRGLGRRNIVVLGTMGDAVRQANGFDVSWNGQ